MRNLICAATAAALLAVAAAAAGDDSDEDRGFGAGMSFTARLSGAQEVPGVDTRGVGRANVRFDAGFTRVFVDLRVSGLTGSFTRAHFHCNRPGANGPVAFGLVQPGPLMFDGRGVRGTLTNADFSGGDCAAVPLVGRPVNNIAALAFAMRDGLIYLNVHTDFVPSGEIRGQLMPSGRALGLTPGDGELLDRLCGVYDRSGRYKDLVVLLREQAQGEEEPSARAAVRQ